MIPQKLTKSDIVKTIEQLNKFCLPASSTSKAEVEKSLLRQGQLEIFHLIEAMQHLVLIRSWMVATTAVDNL